jgi:hypothetical protein
MYSTPGQGGDHPISMSGILDGENASRQHPLSSTSISRGSSIHSAHRSPDAEHAAEIWPSLFGTGIADLPVVQIPSVIAAAMGLPGAKIACAKDRISQSRFNADSSVQSCCEKYSPFSFFGNVAYLARPASP